MTPITSEMCSPLILMPRLLDEVDDAVGGIALHEEIILEGSGPRKDDLQFSASGVDGHHQGGRASGGGLGILVVVQANAGVAAAPHVGAGW
jgi:hypothetical protein